MDGIAAATIAKVKAKAQNDAREVRRTRRSTASERGARVASIASEHGATRVVVGAKYTGASVRV